MEITGKILFISQMENVWQRGTSKQTVQIEEIKDQYPNSLAIDFWGEKCMELVSYNVGDVVKVVFNTKAREYNNKIYNSINAWKIDKVQEKNDGPF